jgi:quercetin dioxygenase-like cupin family protein
MKLSRKSIVFGLSLTAAFTGLLLAQTGVQRTVVQRADSSVAGHEAVSLSVDFAVGATTGRHTHPGDEIDYVVSGEGEWMLAGQPARKAKAGDSIVIPGGTIHEARNTGTQPLKVSAALVVEKGKPMTTPAQ